MTNEVQADPDQMADDERPPPLPPRRAFDSKSFQAKPMTAISPLDIQTLNFPDGSCGTFSTPSVRGGGSTSVRSSSGSGYTTPSRPSGSGVDGDDAASIMSFAPTTRPPGDIASLLVGEFTRKSPAWSLLRTQSATVQPFEATRIESEDPLAGFEREFDAIPEGEGDGLGDEEILLLWKSKLKHYMILSSAGKPIYSRHGDLSLTNSYMGVVQTIISFYEGAKNPLSGFTAGNARFVIATEGPLYLIAISRLGESDSQLRAQLHALYMQVLSTLTLPTLTNIFVNRPSTDLRKPLQGTEPLLSSLADTFTKGSPSALLGALECLKLRKSQRHLISNTFLKLRADKLLYGLVVAGGKLVSVIRPRRHSLHPSDLQLIFNMLFESGNIRAGGGENWIPLCLPAFNNKGYLYMYVSFFDTVPADESTTDAQSPEQPERVASAPEDEIAIILISPDKESFFELKQMRDSVAKQLAKNGSLTTIKAAVGAGRPRVTDVTPRSQISHFIYKSRANVQFTMAAPEPVFAEPLARRRLMTLYHQLHASAHAEHAHLKVLHSVSEEATSLAWITPVFEIYCVAGPNLSRSIMTQGANEIVQWVKREEERLFIIGGGVF